MPFITANALVAESCYHHRSSQQRSIYSQALARENLDVHGDHAIFSLHTVQGVLCREVGNELPLIGTVTVLEATADAQEKLVDEVLEIDKDHSSAEHDVSNENQKKSIKRGDPYGAVLWPAAWAVANYILSTAKLRDNLASLSILELGTGTGLVSIATAMTGAKRVLATDYEPLALSLTNYAATLNFERTISTGGRPLAIETRLLDLCDFETPLPTEFDVVVAADIMYEPKTGIAMAHRCVEALRNNCRVIVGDSPGRAGRPAFLQTLQELGVNGHVFQDTVGKTCSGPRHDLICGKGSTSVSEEPRELPVAIMLLEPGMASKRLSG